MSTAFVTESAAGTGKKYALALMRVRDDGLHFQVFAPGAFGANRNYGFSFTTGLPEGADALVDSAILKALSLAQTGPKYAVVAVNPRNGKGLGETILHVQVRGRKINRSYGASFDVAVPVEVAQNIENLL